MAFDDNKSHRPHPIDQVLEGFSSWYSKGRSPIRLRSKVDGTQSGPSRESGRSIQNWTILSQTGRSFEPKWMVWMNRIRNESVQFHPLRPSCFILLDCSLTFHKNVQFCFFGPSSFIAEDYSVYTLQTVHLHFWRSSSFISLDRPFSSSDRLLLLLETVQPYYFISLIRFPLDRPFWVFWAGPVRPW